MYIRFAPFCHFLPSSAKLQVITAAVFEESAGFVTVTWFSVIILHDAFARPTTEKQLQEVDNWY